MTYATRIDLEERYGIDLLAQRETALPVGAVERALADADAMVDGYLATRYQVPLGSPPSNLPRIVCQIAIHLLLGDAADDNSRADYKAAVDWLRDAASGRVWLACAPASAAAAPAATVDVSSSARLFGREGRP